MKKILIGFLPLLLLTGCANQSHSQNQYATLEPVSVTTGVMKVMDKGSSKKNYWIMVSNDGNPRTKVYINKKSDWQTFKVGKTYAAEYSEKDGKYVLDTKF